MPDIEKERIEDAVESATGGQEWNLKFSPVDLHGTLVLPLVYEAYADQLDTARRDSLGDFGMTGKMLHAILSAGVQATSSPVAILDWQRIQELAASTPAGMSAEDVDELVNAFRASAEARYHCLHPLTEVNLFDREQSEKAKNGLSCSRVRGRAVTDGDGRPPRRAFHRIGDSDAHHDLTTRGRCARNRRSRLW